MAKKKKPVDSTGHTILKNREMTKPPMVMKDKTKYDRKRDKKVVPDE